MICKDIKPLLSELLVYKHARVAKTPFFGPVLGLTRLTHNRHVFIFLVPQASFCIGFKRKSVCTPHVPMHFFLYWPTVVTRNERTHLGSLPPYIWACPLRRNSGEIEARGGACDKIFDPLTPVVSSTTSTTEVGPKKTRGGACVFLAPAPPNPFTVS